MPRLTREDVWHASAASLAGIGRENDKIANRSASAIGLSAALFISIAFLASSLISGCGTSARQLFLCSLICSSAALGTLFAYYTRKSVERARNQLAYLHEHYSALIGEEGQHFFPAFSQNDKQDVSTRSGGTLLGALILFWSVILLVSVAASIWTAARVVRGAGELVCWHSR